MRQNSSREKSIENIKLLFKNLENDWTLNQKSLDKQIVDTMKYFKSGSRNNEKEIEIKKT